MLNYDGDDRGSRSRANIGTVRLHVRIVVLVAFISLLSEDILKCHVDFILL